MAAGYPGYATPVWPPTAPPPPVGYAYHLRYAGLAPRFAAALVDLIVLLLLTVLLALPLGLLAAAAALTVGQPAWWMGLFFGPLLLVLIGLWVLYFTYFEGTSGRTPGKRLFGLRVVDRGTGRPPDLAKAFLRTVLRVIDWLPTLYFLGFLVALLTPQKQRLGDLLAETVVIAE